MDRSVEMDHLVIIIEFVMAIHHRWHRLPQFPRRTNRQERAPIMGMAIITTKRQTMQARCLPRF